MRNYEIMFIIDPKHEDISQISERIKGYVTENKGNIKNEENMGLRKLEYKVKNKEKGRYYLLQFEATPESINEIEREIKIDEDIIRYLITVLQNK